MCQHSRLITTAGAYFQYMMRAVEKLGADAKLAFAKIGVLMASSGISRKPTAGIPKFSLDTLAQKESTPDAMARRGKLVKAAI